MMDPTQSSGKDSDDNKLESGDRDWSHHDRHSRHQNLSSIARKITLLCVVVAITFLLLNGSSYPTDLFRRSYSLSSCDNHSAMQQNVSSPFHQFLTHNMPSPGEEENQLKETLRKAAMEDNKTVIITTLNAAWTDPGSIFDLFLESFRMGKGTEKLLKHVLVGALDQKAYSRCMEKNLHCYALTTDGVDFSGQAQFMSEEYLKVVWRKIDFQRSVLELGYDFVFTDGDIVWMRDPFPRFYPDGDLQISCDYYGYNYTDLHNMPNSGFMYARSSNRTIQFYNFWCTAKEYFPGRHDQSVLNAIKFAPFIKRIGLQIRFLSTAYFGGLCQPSRDLDLVVTMHANCCGGVVNKIHDVKMLIHDWEKYRRNSSSRSWTSKRICGWPVP